MPKADETTHAVITTTHSGEASTSAPGASTTHSGEASTSAPGSSTTHSGSAPTTSAPGVTTTHSAPATSGFTYYIQPLLKLLHIFHAVDMFFIIFFFYMSCHIHNP